MDGIYKLKGTVQHYNWGGKTFIPSLLSISNTDEKPFAEYWLGAHPASPSMLISRDQQSLFEAIKMNGEEVLGTRVMTKFSSLPYLFKILDVRQMLSIQVHPSKESAKAGYEKEDEKGIALSAPNRNYKDQNHKPELMVALNDFWLLHGFKSEDDLVAVINSIPEFYFMLPFFEAGSYKALYEELMTMPQKKVDEVLKPLIQKMVPLYQSNSLKKTDAGFWAARAALTFCKDASYDRGIFSIYLFNLLQLKEGEAIYQPAGLPHAYLEGQNVEVMANSDNVLRAGLTDKHIDVTELMKHVNFEATHPHIIRKGAEAEQNFEAPVAEFLLRKHEEETAVLFFTESATILFVYEGSGKVMAGEKAIDLKKGEAVLMLAGREVSVQPLSPSLSFFSVTTPLNKN